MIRLLIAALALTLAAGGVHAAPKKRENANRDRQLLMQAQQQLKEKEAEMAALQEALDKAKKEKQALEKRLEEAERGIGAARAAARAAEHRGDGLQADLDRARQEKGQLDRQQEALEQRLAGEQKRGAELEQRLASAELSGRTEAAEKERLARLLSAKTAEMNECRQRNLALYGIGNEVLARMENQSFWESVSAAEPFVGLKRVQLENLIQDYQDKLYDQRLVPEAR